MNLTTKVAITLLVTLFFIGACGIDSSPNFTNEEFNINNDIGQIRTKVIYGEDNRKDIFEADKFVDIADATVALVSNTRVSINEENPETSKVRGSKFGPSNGLCKDEPFYNQKSIAFCSGFLVGKDTIVTAGHCITSESKCERTKFVFGIAHKEKLDNDAFNSVANSEIYSCSKLIKTYKDSSGADYAVIKLDRTVEGHSPLKVNRSNILVDTPLVVIGHPSGLPTKIADGAKVKRLADEYLLTDLDTYGGNSGSGVFNAETKEVEGILVRGAIDYLRDAEKDCFRSNVCEKLDETSGLCRGEEVTLIKEVLPYIPPTEEDFFPAYSSKEIPDNTSTGVSSKISFSLNESQKNYKRVLIHVNIKHTWSGDLTLVLTTPHSDRIVLQSRIGGGSDDLRAVYGHDEDLAKILSKSLNVQDQNWTLKVMDEFSRDKGTLQSWGIELVK